MRSEEEEEEEGERVQVFPSSSVHLALLLLLHSFLCQVTALTEISRNCNLGVTCVLSELFFMTLRLWKLLTNRLRMYIMYTAQYP